MRRPVGRVRSHNPRGRADEGGGGGGGSGGDRVQVGGWRFGRGAELSGGAEALDFMHEFARFGAGERGGRALLSGTVIRYGARVLATVCASLLVHACVCACVRADVRDCVYVCMRM